MPEHRGEIFGIDEGPEWESDPIEGPDPVQGLCSKPIPVPPMETLLELVNQFGTFSIKIGRMGSCMACMEGAQFLEGWQMKDCIGWGDSPDASLRSLYYLVCNETIHVEGKKYVLDTNYRWQEVTTAP